MDRINLSVMMTMALFEAITLGVPFYFIVRWPNGKIRQHESQYMGCKA